MNLRTATNFNNGYFKINREERNLAAIFYHTLLLDDNLKRFLDKIGCELPIIENEVGIYFEYAYIRDLWSNIKQGNEFKKKLILDMLRPTNREELEKKSVIEFNSYFGANRTLSADHIASPGNWSIRYYHKNIIDNSEFLKVSKFKWCFNAKPDIVIHTTHNHAVCIEAKFESGEGKYPSNDFEKAIFDNRRIEHVGQLSIQKKIMEELLGIQSKYIFLVQKKSETATHEAFTWKEVFECFDTTTCPYFIKQWLNRSDIN
ncbi:MAG: hypothetical protein HY960_07545 [Ignavibacteriae bacterium]|nr:hypothetical protein [Ignavibacteriota bacterium]